MTFKENLKEMIDSNSEVFNWFTCAQIDGIGEDTRFVIATTQINNGVAFCGDGRIFGEWAWFNNPQDLRDYITHLIIPLHLCQLEDQDPRAVVDGATDGDIFGYEFSPKNVRAKDELQRLWIQLKDMADDATFDKIKDALAQSQKRSQEIDCELIFGYRFFDGYREACQELSNARPFDVNNAKISQILKAKTLSDEDVRFLQKTFADNSLY